MHLLIFFSLLIFHVSSGAPNADNVANHLMTLLKDSIDLQQLEALPAFMTRSFTWDTCRKVLDFNDYVRMLRMMSEHKGDMPAMSTDWSVLDAHFNNSVLYFKIHNNDKKYGHYSDLLFEAKNDGSTGNYIFTKGKLDKCGSLEQSS